MFNRGWNLTQKFNSAVLVSLTAIFCLFSSVFAAAQTTLSATAVNFYNVATNTTSPAKTVTLKNTGAASITINSLAVTSATPYSIAPASTCLNPTLAAGASCTVALNFSPVATGSQPSTLTITTTAPNPTSTVALSGLGVIPSTASPAAVNFGNVAVGAASVIKTVTLTNNQSASLGIVSIGVSGSGYAIDPSTTCPNSGTLTGVGLPATDHCTIALTLTPATLGAAPAGTLTIKTNANNSPQTVALSGTGVSATTLSASALNFGNVVVNATSAIQTVTLTNNQTTALGIVSITVPGGGYALAPSTTCSNPGTLAAGSSCTIAVTLTPAAVGALPAGSLTVSTNAPDTPKMAALSGTGVAPVSLIPSSVSFGSVTVGATSTAKSLVLVNNQSSALTYTGVVFNGPFVLDTSAVTTCQISGGTLSGTLPTHSSCVIGVDFSPTVVGATVGGQITVLDNAPNSPQLTSLSGTGVASVTLSTSAVNFGWVAINSTSASTNVTLTNNQAVKLNFTSISTLAPYAVVPATTTCVAGTPVAPGGSCVISLSFAPTVLGAAPAGTLTISDDAPSTPQTVSLSGEGLAPVTLTPAGLGFGTVVVNNAVVKSLTLKNYQTVALSISSITGFSGGYSLSSANTTCPLAPLTVPAGGSCVIAVSLTATAPGAQSGTISINDGASTTPQTFGLSAVAVEPVVLSPLTLVFPTQYVGTASLPEVVTLTNEQAVALHIASATITGTNSNDFGVTTTCPLAPTPLAATTGCPLSVTFKPTLSGARTATLTITDDATGSPQTVTLAGTGNAPVSVLPALTAFSMNVGMTSSARTITITNNDVSVPLHITSLQLSGEYTQTASNCPIAPAALAGGISCTVSVEFAPTIGGPRDGQLQVYDDALTSPQVVNFKGTGSSPLITSTTVLSFSAQMVGTVSTTPKTFMLINHESEQETFSLASSGDFTASSSCSTGVIAANSSCPVFVNFTPSATGTRNGSVTVTDSAPGGSPLVVSLSGSGAATNPAAAVAVVSPGAGPAGTTVNVVITGNTWTHFNASSVISFTDVNSGTYPVDITATVPAPATTTANTINAQFTIPANTVANPVTYGARNIYVRTPLSGGGTETAFLSAAFVIVDPNNAHTITTVTPNFGTQGQSGMNVNLTATGTNFIQGTTYANFGDGVTINSLTVTDATHAQANITISNTTPVGYRIVTLVTGGEFAKSSSTAAFQIGPNNAALLSLKPNSAAQGASLPVTITASGTHFLQNATQISFTGGILSPEVTVTSPTTATAQLAVPAGATIGLQNATISTGGEIATLNNAFTVTGATPYLIGVSPSSGQQGQTLDVILTGNAYTTFPVGVYLPPFNGAMIADFTGEITVNKITVSAANSVDVNITVSPNANVGGITARLTQNPSGAATIFPFGFTVTASSASITSVTPSCVPQGGQMTLSVTGSNTGWVQGTTIANFYPVPVPEPSVDEVTINSTTSASVAVAVPTNAPAGNYEFYLATGGQIVNASLKVCLATPTLTVSPANGLLPSGSAVNNVNVSFTGQFTHFGPTTLPVISGEGVTLTGFTITGPTSATATIKIIAGTNGTPTATGPRLITFTTGGEIVTTYFNVTQTPVGLISISPYHAAQSVTLDVAIVGLNTHFTAGTTQVLFGPQITVNSTTVVDTTHLTVNITTSFLDGAVTLPSPPGWQNVYVNTGAEQVMGGFLVDSPAQPSLVSVCVTGSNPCVSSAQQGASVGVTITGSSNPTTNWVSGTTEAILGAGVTVSNLVITSPNTATATIAVSPTAPVGGNTVIMITGSEIESGIGFSVTQNAALIYSVAPTGVCNADAVTIANFCGVSGGAGVPYVISQLQTATLNVVGVGTHWLQGETTFSFGSGVSTDSLTVTSPTTAQVQITVLSSSPVGFAPLTTTTAGEVVTLQQAIDIEEGFPTMLATSPAGAEQGATLTLQVLGRFTNWGPTTTAAFNQDIKVNSVNVIDSDNLQLNITVSPNAYVDFSSPCGHVLTVTTGTVQVVGSIASGYPGLFCVAQGAEQITGVSPNVAVQQSSGTVTITGSATNFLPGISQVSFGDSGISTGTVNVTSPTSLTVPIAVSTSSAVGYHTVTVTTLGEVATEQYAFTVSPGVATLNEAIPNQAEQGAPIITSPTCKTLPTCTVRLIGQYSHFSGLSTATFGAGITVQSVAYVSPTEVDAQINIDPLSYTGGRLVTVTTPGVPCADMVNDVANRCPGGATTGTGSEIVKNTVFTIIPGPAIISQVAPATGNEGQEVVFNITGEATHWAQNFTQFWIPGAGYDLTVNSVVINSATSATVDLSISPTANPGARSIYMVTNGETLTDSGAFVVTGGVPVIAYVSPNSALQGTTGLGVDIYGIFTQWSTANTTINFGPGVSVASFQVDNATHIEAVLNIAPGAQAGYRTVQATTTGITGAPGGVQVLTGNFLVTAPAPPPTPYIWYENPSSGIPGQTLTINFSGAYTHWDPNPTTGTQLTGFDANQVTINTFQVTSPTTATANITISYAATAAFYDLTLTTNTTTPQEVDNAGFSVVVAQPTLSVVDPGAGMQGAQNLVVNILGQFTAFDSTTTFNFGPGITVNGAPTILGPTIATQSISIAQLATLGGRSVVATTPDASASNQITVGGAGFSVSPSLALISAISPNTAKQSDTPQVEITGQNTHWDGSTIFQFGAGIVVTKYQVNTPTDATVWLAIPAYAPEGPTWASATTLGEVASINNGFVVQAGTPYLLSSGPGSEPQQGSAVFTILSQATQWLTNPPTVSYGPGIVLTNVTVTSNTSLTVDGYVTPTTNVGYYNLTVSTGTQVLGLQNAVYVTSGPAVINNVSASSGGQGATLNVNINGTNTHWVNGTTTLNFPNVLINSWTVVSPTLITANITVSDYAPAGQETVQVTTLGEVATGVNVFTVIQTQPELLAVVASSGAQAQTESVTLTGQFTHFVSGSTTAGFGTGVTVNSVTVTSATTLVANITVQPTTTLGARNVSVTDPSETVSLNNAFNVIAGPAAIAGALNPASGPQGAASFNVTITGSQTHWAQGVTTASFGGGISVTGVTVSGPLSATVTISIPTSTPLGAYNVTLTTGGEVATILGGFTVTTGSPYLSVVNAPTGNQGATNLNVTLTGVFTHFNTAAGCSPCSVASFGAGITVNTTTASSSTSAVANITISPTAALGARNVTVTTGPAETASITGGFTVLAGIPAITTILPTSAQAGTTANIVINGAFTNFQAGSTVSFGSGVTVNLISNVTATQLTANITVAPNATVGARDVVVTTSGQPVTLSGGFNVTAGTPVITQISPNIGNPGQSALTVTITGQYTNWTTASTVTIGTPADGITVVGAAGPGLPGPVVTATATSITVSINIAAGAPVGPADVTVSATPVVPGGFTVQAAVIPAPSLISLSPGANAGGIPINSSFTAVFSQPMNRTTFTNSGTSGTVILYLISNQGQGWYSVPVTLSVDATGRVLTITPNSPLAVNAQYYLELTSGIKDATVAGNPINNYGVYLYTVFSANTTPATVVAANPPANVTGIGTNVTVQLEFSTDMNQTTSSGLTVSTAGNPVAGSFVWNSNPYGSAPGWGPGTVLTFTPAAPLAANTVYTVSYGAPLADTAGNALTPGSFTFTTGSGSDTAQNYTGSNIENNQTNVGTNVAPVVTFSKPINPLDITPSTLLIYNADSGKYINGTVTVAPSGMSATFTPSYPLLPNTYYYLHMAWGYYDADGNYLNGINQYFYTGSGADLTAPDVASFSPAGSATAVPLNAQVIVHFTAPVNPLTAAGTITVTPSGGSAISGTATLASDLVTLFFVPTTALQPSTVYTVTVSGYADVVGNVGTTRSSTFTTATSIAPINVSTGISASGHLITTGNTADPHWSYVATSSTPSGESNFKYPGDAASDAYTGALQVVASGDADWYGGWDANGPSSSWIAINPNSSTGNSAGFYSTAFNLASPLPAHLCLVGAMSHDDNGLLAVNGQAIMGDQGYTGGSLVPFNIEITSHVNVGTNYLTFAFGSTDNSLEGLRLQGAIETCGASETSATSVNNSTANLVVTSATPSYSAGGVATNSTITLTFNNPLDPNSVNSTTLPIMVGWNSNQEIAGGYVTTGNQVVFTPDTPFPASTQIWIGACNGPFDLAGDSAAYNGCYTQITYFTTGATATPVSVPFQVVAFSPAASATNVGLRAPVVATFNRSLNLGSVNANDYALFNGDSQSPWCSGGSYSHSQDGTTIAFNCGALPSSATLTAVLGSGLQDWNGDALANYTSQFSTTYYDSNSNGSVISERPGNGASGVSANQPLTIYTNLPINASGANSGIQVAQNDVAVPGTVNVLDGGYTLEFTPSSAWTPGALIQWWTTGSLTDSTYNTNINTTSGYFYVAASTSTLAPALQTASPVYGANPVALNSTVDLQFNTPLSASTVNSTNIYLYDGTTGLHVAGTYTMPQPNEVRIVPSANLNPNHYIYVYVTTGLQSATSVPFANTTWVTYFYTGTAADTTLPTVASAVPYNGASGVGVNASPGFVFSKQIDPVSVNSNTFQVLNGATPLAGSYWFNSASGSLLTDERVEFVPNAPLPANTNLTMTLNGVLDQVGNPITFSSSFQTGAGPDFTTPSIVWTSIPSNGSVPTNSAITIQFSESMDATTFSAGSNGDIYIYDSLLNTRVPATLSWNSSQTVAYLLPTSALAAGREYYFYVNTGTDIAGNQVNGFEVTFYAEFNSATTAPTVINFNPLTGATGLGTNVIVEAQFSAPIDPTNLTGVTLSHGGSTVPTSPSLSAANTVLQLIPATPLAANTLYVVTIAGVKDPAGNAVATVTSTFTTGSTYDLVSATAINSDPANNAHVGINVTPKLVFNKPLNPIMVNNSYFRMYMNDTGQWIPLTVTQSPDGLTVTMQPQVPLLPNTEYYFQACCGYQDQDGNNGNGVNVSFYTNGGAVTTAPTVTVSPSDTATGIPLNAQVIVSVSAPIDPTSWTQNSIQLLNGVTPVAGTVSESNTQTLVFAPTSALSPSLNYTVKVAGFTDANGNAVAPSNTSFTTGTTASSGGLTLVSTNIPNGSTLVSVTQQIILTFSQVLDPVTVNSSTMEVMDTWNSNRPLAATYAVSGNQVTITPVVQWPSGANVTVGECGGPTDILGDVFYSGNCWQQQLANFTVISGSPDTSALTVVSVSPASGATNVRHDLPVSITFNKAINPGTTGSYNTQLYAGQDLQNNGSVNLSADGRTMTFNIGALNGTTYTIELPAGGVADESGNALASNFISTFTTASNPATGNGAVQSSNPTSNASGVPTNSLLTLYMNRQVNPATVSGNLTVTVNGQVYAGNAASAAGGYEVQFTPSVAFPNSATVQWFLSGNMLDVYGNPINGDSGYFYTAAAVNPATASPQIVAVSPAYGSTNVPVNAQIFVEYSLPINAATLTTSNVYFNGSLPETVTQVSPTLVQVALQTPPFSPSTYYYVCDTTGVQGTNNVAAQGGCWTTYFETTATGADTTSGTVNVGPPNGSANVGTNAHIRLQFSKPLNLTSLNSTSVAITTGGNPIPGTWSYNYSGSDVIGASFSPVNPLSPSSTIKVSVSGLTDYAGNLFNEPTVQFTTATTPDYSAPTVSTDFPYWTTGIGTNASFNCRFSEPIDPSSVTASGFFIYSYTTSAYIPATLTVSADMLDVTITPKSALAANAQYYYTCYNAVDLTGNGQSNESDGFYTGSGPVTTGPALVAANPPNGYSGVPLNTNNGPWYGSSLGLLFSEPVASDSLGSITLTPAGGSPLPIAVYPEDGNYIVWVQLPSALLPSTTYTYNIAGVTDYNGNLMTTATSSFTTGTSYDWTTPVATAATPANNATAVNDTTPGLSVTFNEPMDPVLIDSSHIYLRTHNTQVTVPTTFTLSADYTTVYLTPTAPLTAGTIYELVTASPEGWYLYSIAGNYYYQTGVVTTFTTQ